MYCPLLCVALQTNPRSAIADTACRRGDCAWWHHEAEMCAVLSLAKTLPHHLANIAGNTAKIGG